MAAPKGKMKIVVFAELKGHQAPERLVEVVRRALYSCEHIVPVVGSVVVRETLPSRFREWCRQHRARARARLKGRKCGIVIVGLVKAAVPVIVAYLLESLPQRGRRR